MMAFQAGGPHAQDRALEALAYAYEEMTRTPHQARWSKPQGKHDPLQLDKTFRLSPRGIGLVIGCSTFPTWNSYPGLFASLATGNPVVVKPHPGAVLPLAITVAIFHEVLAEAGLPREIVALAPDGARSPHTMELALRPEVKLIDYTGSAAFGNWLEENTRQAQVFAEKSGVNSVIVDGTDDLKGMVRNLAFSLSLYSGQMCTSPQNLYIPQNGIDTPDGKLDADGVCSAIAEGVRKFLSDPDRAAEVLGGIQSEATLSRLGQAAGLGEVVLASETREHPKFPDARVRTPLLIELDGAHADPSGEEWFGPIAFFVITDSTDQSIPMARELADRRGAMTWAVYSRSDAVLENVEEAALEVGVALSCNLTKGVFVNQSAAFSDFHGTSGNPACSACLSDGDFVASRFRVVQSRRQAA